MKFKKIEKVSLMVFVAVLCLFILAHAEDEGPEQLKVKGIYMGMDIDEAKKICRKYMDQTMTFEELTPDKHVIFQQGSRMGVLGTDAENKLVMIALGRPILDNMFKAEGMPIKDFAVQFVSAYKITSMKAFKEQGDRGWRFTSPHGYKVEIYRNGQLSIEKVAKRDALIFD
jgi:hypothetical protein